jgi:PPIC-type PPIASE domain
VPPAPSSEAQGRAGGTAKAFRILSCPVVPFVLVVALGACGGGSEGAVAVRVAGKEITRTTLAQQMAVIAPEHIVPDPPHFKQCIAHLEMRVPGSIASVLKQECRQQYLKLKGKALRSLISSRWLIGEATQRGLSVSDGTLARRTQVTESKLRQALMSGEPKITQGEVAAYYRQNLQRFERRERRYLDIVEHLPSKAIASAALREVVRRADMSKIAIPESFDKMKEAETVPWKRAILKAIFAARPHTLVGPLPLNEEWCFFEVTRVTPRVVKRLARVQGTIEHQIVGEQRRRTLARVVSSWRKKWIAQTDCSPGYVVQKCRQYRGPRTPEDPLAFN